VFAYLMTNANIRQRLIQLYDGMRADRSLQVDVPICPLDTVLWTAAKRRVGAR
jgi:hypothetical protein